MKVKDLKLGSKVYYINNNEIEEAVVTTLNIDNTGKISIAVRNAIGTYYYTNYLNSEQTSFNCNNVFKMFTSFKECINYQKFEILKLLHKLMSEKSGIEKEINKYEKLLNNINKAFYICGCDPINESPKINVITKDGEIKD